MNNYIAKHENNMKNKVYDDQVMNISKPLTFWTLLPHTNVAASRLSPAYIHKCMYTHIYIYTYIQTYIHTYIYTYIHTHIHTHIHTYKHTCIQTTSIHPSIYTCIQIYIYIYIQYV